jgi:hypothetical protein
MHTYIHVVHDWCRHCIHTHAPQPSIHSYLDVVHVVLGAVLEEARSREATSEHESDASGDHRSGAQHPSGAVEEREAGVEAFASLRAAKVLFHSAHGNVLVVGDHAGLGQTSGAARVDVAERLQQSTR